MSSIRSRGYLPHLENRDGIYFVTFRLAGSLPACVLESWEFERKGIQNNAKRQNRPLSPYEIKRLSELYSERIESYLDKGLGDCWLRDPKIADIVVSAIMHFNNLRYHLFAWCVMPNHVHVVLKVLEINGALVSLNEILHSWKSYTSHQGDKLFNRSGQFWQREFYDHLIRNDEQLNAYIQYTLQNPVTAGLCSTYQEWPWSGCTI